MLLDAERIGHGLMLPRHPALFAQAAGCGIPSVEVCPISNQVLGYVPNLMDHPGLLMLRNGVRITINNGKQCNATQTQRNQPLE
jgi:adenosine deaminase